MTSFRQFVNQQIIKMHMNPCVLIDKPAREPTLCEIEQLMLAFICVLDWTP